MPQAPMIPYRPPRVPPDEVVRRLEAELEVAQARRSVRQFSRDPVPREAIEAALRVAGTAPSGAHRQPWQFVAVGDPDLKRRIREGAEVEERAFYAERATPDWLAALEPLGTDEIKEHLTDAPWVIVVFRRDADVVAGVRQRNYYVAESVGIAVGMLLAALHRAGLVALTHTPAPMAFLRELCGRPAEEKPFLLLPVGYPAEGCRVPELRRKGLEEIASFR